MHPIYYLGCDISGLVYASEFRQSVLLYMQTLGTAAKTGEVMSHPSGFSPIRTLINDMRRIRQSLLCLTFITTVSVFCLWFI
jgi:hypothetical protein